MTSFDGHTLDGAEQLRDLCDQMWLRIMVIGKPKPSKYSADIVFHAEARSVKVTGEAHILEDGGDIFSLKIRDHDEQTWWPEFRRDYGVRDFAQEWKDRAVSRLFHPPRNVRFFMDEEFDDVLYTREAILMRCVAMEFWTPEDPKPRLLITAEQCNISVFIDDECEENIRPHFVEYDPGPF